MTGDRPVFGAAALALEDAKARTRSRNLRIAGGRGRCRLGAERPQGALPADARRAERAGSWVGEIRGGWEFIRIRATEVVLAGAHLRVLRQRGLPASRIRFRAGRLGSIPPPSSFAQHPLDLRQLGSNFIELVLFSIRIHKPRCDECGECAEQPDACGHE